MLESASNYVSKIVNLQFAANVTEVTARVDVSFIPDQIIVSSVVSADASTDSPPISSLRTDLVTDRVLCFFHAGADILHRYDIPFKNHRAINGDYSFTLRGESNLPFAHDATIDVGLMLTFVKF